MSGSIKKYGSGISVPLLILAAGLIANSCFRDGLDGGSTEHPNRRTQHDSVTLEWDIIENKWFLGENLRDGRSTFRKPYTPHFAPHVRGSDNGVSVRLLNGNTVVYMGDSEGYGWGAPNPFVCGAGSECNDPIMIINPNDTNPADGVNAKLVYDSDNPAMYYRPLTIPGVNQKGYSVINIDEQFSYATGADLGIVTRQVPVGDGGIMDDAGTNIDAGTVTTTEALVYLWFATEIKASRGRSFLACSRDGIEFHNCQGLETDEAELFSTDKFVLVNPVSIDNELWSLVATVCDDVSDPNNSGSLCMLRSELLSDEPSEQLSGMLLFGSRGGPKGENPGVSGYRESPLYLAYLQLTTGNVWYFTGNGWAENDESRAVKVLYQGMASDEDDRNLYWFGEFSVRPVTTGSRTYLVLLSNHANITNDKLHNLSVIYRTASLYSPDKWSTPLQTCGRGYGPYIIDQYTKVKSGRLTMYHMIQGWNGTGPSERNHEAYGVFTTRLRLRNNGECTPPPWPPE